MIAHEIDLTDRDTAIAEIKKALKQRTGRSWSVTGGKGTAWGWITINAQPKDRVWEHVKLPVAGPNGEEWEEKATAGEYGHMGPELREELRKALNLERVHYQGEMIAPSNKHRLEYVARARGETPTVRGEIYWD